MVLMCRQAQEKDKPCPPAVRSSRHEEPGGIALVYLDMPMTCVVRSCVDGAFADSAFLRILHSPGERKRITAMGFLHVLVHFLSFHENQKKQQIGILSAVHHTGRPCGSGLPAKHVSGSQSDSQLGMINKQGHGLYHCCRRIISDIQLQPVIIQVLSWFLPSLRGSLWQGAQLSQPQAQLEGLSCGALEISHLVERLRHTGRAWQGTADVAIGLRRIAAVDFIDLGRRQAVTLYYAAGRAHHCQS